MEKERNRLKFDASTLSYHFNIFVCGVCDSLSLHKLIPLLVNNQDLAVLTGKILATNCVMLVGSVLLYQRGMGPILQYIGSTGSENSFVNRITETILSILYQTFWLIPICALCYACSITWYQELSDCTIKLVKGNAKSVDIAKTVGFALYGTIVWFFIFLQVQLLLNISPILINGFIIVFSVGTSNFMLSPLFYLIRLLLISVRMVIQFGGFFLMSMLYGWYGFDPKWISEGVDPDARLNIMERRWVYFAGFGFPYAVLMKSFSFFVGYGVFLGVFPFCIMLGTITDYNRCYSQNDGDKKILKTDLPIFKTAQNWSLHAVKYVNKFTVKAKTKKINNK